MSETNGNTPSGGPLDPEAGLDPAVIVSVRDLRVHFQSKAGIVQAVDGVSFDVHDGETLGLVGETGCGKSVTARSFLGLVPSPPALPAQGSIMYRYGNEAIDLVQASDRQRADIRGNRIAMIFQDPGKALNPALTVGDQLGEVFLIHRTADIMDRAGLDSADGEQAGALVRRHAGMKSRWPERLALALPPWRRQRDLVGAAVDEMVVDALAETQIPNPAKLIDRYPHELSGGMKQRVMIAQALACNPDVLIADEPTTALDVTVQARIVELIEDLKTRHRTSVLYISHDLSLVRRVCDRIAVMYAGRIAEIGDADEVFNNPLHPYTRGLLAAIPSMASERARLEAIDGTVPELIDPEPGCRFASRCRHATDLCRSVDPVAVDPDSESDGGSIVSCLAYGDVPDGGDSGLTRPTLDAAGVGSP